MSMHPGRNLFKEFRGTRKMLVETGSYRGDAIQLGLEAGFRWIRSMDIEASNIDFCKHRFDLHRNGPLGDRIELLVGDSAVDLHRLIPEQPSMFWLDAHAQYLEHEPEVENPYPLLMELAQIAATQQTQHIIMIDDMLHLTHPLITGWTREGIEGNLRMINPDYKFEYFANPVRKSILVAYP